MEPQHVNKDRTVNQKAVGSSRNVCSKANTSVRSCAPKEPVPDAQLPSAAHRT